MKISFNKAVSTTLLVCTVAISPLFCARIANAQQVSHGIAAVVNDDVVTTYDLKQRARFMIVTQGIKPDEKTQQRIIRQAMRTLVDEKLQMQEAQKYEQTISEQEIMQGVQNVISRNGINVNEFTQNLAAAGIPLTTLKDQMRAEIAWQRIIGGLYGSRIRISDAQIDETLNRITANSSKPSYRVAEIFIEATPDIGGMEGAMQGGEAMVAQLKEGAPFRVLAQQFSSAASAAKGGDIGWVAEGELREEINAVLPQMEKGSISKPITVPGGVYVIALIDKQISKSETFYKLGQINYKVDDESETPAARTAIKAASAKLKSCDTLKKDVEGMDGIAAQNMGEVKASDLGEEIIELLSKTNVGEVSEPLVLPTGVVGILVCDRKVRGANIPNRNQIENRLMSQQEAIASKRHLRNLRRKATIVTR
ncbi:MAG: peptidylprolyl isomerase [Robiginitomaculum sp.]